MLNYSFPDTLPLNLNSRLAAKLPTVVMADGGTIAYIREMSGIMSSNIEDIKPRSETSYRDIITACVNNNG